MSRPKCYHTMDAFVKLVVVLVRYSGEPSNTLAKVNLLNKVRYSIVCIEVLPSQGVANSYSSIATRS